MTSDHAITELLHSAAGGDQKALEEVMRSVYASLEQLASSKLRKRYGQGLPGITLEPGALVNETLLNVLRSSPDFANRRHFFSFANQVMKRVLIDYERGKQALRRGGDAERVTLSGLAVGEAASTSDVVQVIDLLAEHYPRQGEIVGLRLFWGMEHGEIAEILDLSLRTVERDWRFAKAWIRGRLDGAPIVDAD
ncbi:MAG: ECF-type sigma factor [Acidobacteriota bacterium]